MAMASLKPAYCASSLRLSRNGEPGYGPFASSTSFSFSCSCLSSSSSFNFSSGINNWKHQGFKAQDMSTTIHQNFASSRGIVNGRNDPDHLLVLVHGIMGSPSNWTYVEAELKRRLGRNFLIYASSSNTCTKTFCGVDGAGKRLADEVMQIVKKTSSLKKISFLAHSLGGLLARYAVAVLYRPTTVGSGEPFDLVDSKMANSQTMFSTGGGIIAGLEPVNFITLGTPHLGVRGRKQLPFLFGVPILEKLAPPLAPILVGRTGSQLFLTDAKPSKPPLLLRMASDWEDIKFLSALGAFSCRILYANVSYDYMVGWRTSSIRRETELVKPPCQSLDGYEHVVDVEYCAPVSSDGPPFTSEAVKTKEAAQKELSIQYTVEYYEIVEEEMIRGLQQLGWKKVDVSFHSALWPFFAHNNLQVQNEWLHNAGAGVVAHVADSLRRQESSSLIATSL